METEIYCTDMYGYVGIACTSKEPKEKGMRRKEKMALQEATLF